jgi:hypothetical protein
MDFRVLVQCAQPHRRRLQLWYAFFFFFFFVFFVFFVLPPNVMCPPYIPLRVPRVGTVQYVQCVCQCGGRGQGYPRVPSFLRINEFQMNEFHLFMSGLFRLQRELSGGAQPVQPVLGGGRLLGLQRPALRLRHPSGSYILFWFCFCLCVACVARVCGMTLIRTRAMQLCTKWNSMASSGATVTYNGTSPNCVLSAADPLAVSPVKEINYRFIYEYNNINYISFAGSGNASAV